MTESETGDHDVEHEDLLEGQTVFKGPRKLRKHLLSGSDVEDSD